MPSPQYTKLLDTCAQYFDKEKATSVIARQLNTCKATPDTFSQDNLKSIVTLLAGSLSLYVADAGKRQQLIDSIKSMAA